MRIRINIFVLLLLGFSFTALAQSKSDWGVVSGLDLYKTDNKGLMAKYQAVLELMYYTQSNFAVTAGFFSFNNEIKGSLGLRFENSRKWVFGVRAILANDSQFNIISSKRFKIWKAIHLEPGLSYFPNTNDLAIVCGFSTTF